MPISPIWDVTDRLTATYYVAKEETRLADYTQFLNALTVIDNWFSQDHSTQTGRHITQFGLDDWVRYDVRNLLPLVASGSLGGMTFDIIGMVAQGGGLIDRPFTSGWIRAVMDSGGGIVEILPVYMGYQSLNVIGVFSRVLPGLRRLTAGTSNDCSVRSAYFGLAGPEIGILLETGPGGSPYTMEYESAPDRPYRCQTTDIIAAGGAMDKAIYRQCWRLAYNLTQAMYVEHDGNTMISLPPSPLRMASRVIMPPTVHSQANDGQSFNIYDVGNHGGAHYYVLPWISYPQNILIDPNPDRKWWITPAFDDTKVYLCVQQVGSGPMTEPNEQLSIRAAMFRDASPADIQDLPTLNLASAASQENAIKPDDWQQLYDGLLRYWRLFGVEHEQASGAHAFPINTLPGAELIYNGPVTAPETEAEIDYTWTSYIAGSSVASSYTDITLVDLGPIVRSGGDLLIGSLVGGTESGIAMLTFAVDDLRNYAVIRRLTSDGDYVPFLLRVWRIDQAVQTSISGGYVTKSGSTLVYSPDWSNEVRLYDGASWVRWVIPAAGITVTCTGLTASTAYYLYVYVTGGNLTLELSTTAPDTQDGIYVKTGSTGYLLLARCYADGTGEVLDTAVSRGFVNLYNKRNVVLTASDATNSWTLSSTSWRKANNADATKLECVCDGVEAIDIMATAFAASQDTNGLVGIGVDSATVNTAAPTGVTPYVTGIYSQGSAVARLVTKLAAGYHYIHPLERCAEAASVTFFGDAGGSDQVGGTVMISMRA